MLIYEADPGNKLTWRQLGEAISMLPEEVLDFTAEVWLPQDGAQYDEFQGFISLAGFDMSEEISPDNPPSLATEH